MLFSSKKTSLGEDFCLTASLPSCLEKEEPFFSQSQDMLLESDQSVVIAQNTFKDTVPIMVFEGSARASMTSSSDSGKEAFEYVVVKGDTLSLLSEKFDISLETILWANDLSRSSKIIPGQKLIILPVSGLTHLVGDGDTLSKIALLYKADASEIKSFNFIKVGY